MRKRYVTCSGYTLIEILLAISLTLAILAWAGPAMSGIVVSIKVQAGAQAIADTLVLARHEAVKRNARVVICKSATGSSCRDDGGWEQGWIVFQDPNNNAELDADESVLHREQGLSQALSLRGNTPVSRYVSYTPYGKTKLISGAFQAGTFTVCMKSGHRAEVRQVIINSAGRPRVAKATPADCTREG